MKICFLGTYDPVYTSNKLVIEGLAQNNVEVLEVNVPITVTRLTTKSDMSWRNLILRIWNKNRILFEIVKKAGEIKKTDVIYVGYPGHFDVFYAFIVAKLLRKKLVFNPLLIIYTGFSEEQAILKKRSIMGYLIKTTESLVYRCCDLVFADTPFQEKFLKRDFNVPKEKLRVLPLGADNKYYRYTPYTNMEKKLNVVYYGLYSPIHGVEHIIECARQLKNDRDITFTFVGNGNTFKENYKKAQKLKLANCIFYHETPVSEHPSIIEKGDIFLGFLQKHPTVDRVIPNKIYQGLALNKVVLTADSPVVRSLFEHKENMYFVDPANPKSLVDALIELKNNPLLRKKIAENGYALYQKKYNPKVVTKQMVNYISEIL